MPAKCVVGVQWGDEGKGKILDLMADGADLIVRYQGGANAGHTVVTHGQEYIFHLIPSGILHPDKVNIIGNGVVLDPQGLLQEMDRFTSRGVVIEKNLLISSRAHLVMPYHKALDGAEEKQRTAKIGTTLRGIGPSYMDKMARVGLRTMDLVDFDRFTKRLKEILPMKNRILTRALDSDPISEEQILEEFVLYAKRLTPYVADTGPVIRRALEEGKSIFFEGAQGALLDIDHGTYPYVTSSNSCALGIPAGAGVPPHAVGHILGVVKSYTTRVGGGPFPTEISGELGEHLRTKGGEFGATTGRPRRCGWLDGFALKYVVALNGIKSLAVTKLDVLSGLDNIKICTAYKTPHGFTAEYPADVDILSSVEPVYETFPGWKEDLSSARDLSELPEAAQGYLDAISLLVGGVPVDIVSVGPDRKQTLFRPAIL
jgi:adenylosuccinate synthase